ncbi:50S ribosomal protein L15 [Mycoplasma todarodis]|uniref:50S ribosomal protein L15 n=1 Tax=Mycoplasma todarodis TaxID=1937191 RepID=UPI003B37D1D5
MKLHELKSTEGSRKLRTRKGRGHAAGKGKTAGRGENGQNKRSGGGVRPGFEGGQNPWFRRLPKRGFTNVNHVEYETVNLSTLEKAFNANDVVTKEILLEKRITRRKTMPVKVLGNGKITKALTIQVQAISASAKAAIEAAGGKVEVK